MSHARPGKLKCIGEIAGKMTKQGKLAIIWIPVAVLMLAQALPAAAYTPGSAVFAVQQKVSPTDPKASFQAGQAALQKGDLEAAEKAFQQVLSIDENSGAAYANLGVIAMRRKNWGEALKNLKKAERLLPKVAGIRLNIGLVEFRRGNYELAIPPLKSVVKDEPKDTQARYLLGLCQVFIEDYAAAVETLEPLWVSMSKDVMYLYALDMAADKSGNKALDEKAMKQMVSVGEDTAEFHLIMAKAHLQHHEHDEALQELKKVEAINPSLPFLHFNLGFAYLGNGDLEKSESEFLKDIAIDPDLPDNYYQLGVVYSQTQRPRDAEMAFRKALERDPHRPGAWFGLAKIYSEEGRNEEALKALDEALKAVPNSEKVHFVRGQVLQRLGRKDEANSEFEISKKLMNEKLNKDREDLEEKLLPSPELKQSPN
jgi:tetratricopeptide (TPR) repeat protein